MRVALSQRAGGPESFGYEPLWSTNNGCVEAMTVFYLVIRDGGV